MKKCCIAWLILSGTICSPLGREIEMSTLPEKWDFPDHNYTFYQVGGKYDPKTACQTSAVKVHVSHGNPAPSLESYTVAATYDPKYLMVDMGTATDANAYFVDGGYDGNKYPEVATRKRDGTEYRWEGFDELGWRVLYILPTKVWNDYLLNSLKKSVEHGAKTVTIQEIGVFGEWTGYEQAFRNEWRSFYNDREWDDSIWEDGLLWTDKNYYFMGQELRNYLCTEQVHHIFSGVKESFPGTQCIAANHTSMAYWSFSNSSGNHDLMSIDVLDGMEGQTWSNTMEIPIFYNGRLQKRQYLNGSLDYSYWANLQRQFPTKSMSVITDPKGDFSENWTLDECMSNYRHQIVAQLKFPNIYRYNCVVWPDRIYGDIRPLSTGAFKTVVNNIVSMQGQMYKYQAPYITDNQPVRVGVFMLDASCYQAGGPDNNASYNNFYVLALGLMYNGLDVETIPFGRNESHADDLKDYDVLLLSYSMMKPQNKLLGDELKKYVKNGGTVIFVNGNTSYEDIGFGWWRSRGFDNPQDELFDALGISASGRDVRIKGAATPVAPSSIANAGGPVETVNDLVMVGYENVGTAEPLYRADGKTVAFDQKIGSGHFIYLGFDPAYFSLQNNGDVLFHLVSAVTEKYMNVKPQPKTYLSYRRGPIYGINAVSAEYTAEPGVYINLFDEKIPLVNTITVPHSESALLLDVSEKTKLDAPTVLFAQGLNPSVTERKDITRIITAGPHDTVGAVRIYIPEGYSVSEVKVYDVNKNDVLIAGIFDGQTRTYLVEYHNRIEQVTVDVKYINKKN